mgnify:FL=1
MARPGRKRKLNAYRYPNGSVKPEEGPSPCATKRLIMASLAGMADPQWGTVPGRYFLSGMLDHNQYEAAKKYGALCEAYAQVLLGPRHPKTSTGERGSISSTVDPDTELGQIEADFHIRTRQRYNQAKTLLLGYSPAIERELEKFCVGNGNIPTYEDMRIIKQVLAELAMFWKIDVK